MARAERNGKRKGREHFRTRVPDLGYYIIVTDTEATEKNYLHGLRESLPKDVRERLIIKVNSARTARLVEKCQELTALEPQYAEPWIVFDRDLVTNFDAIIAKAERNGIHVAWSNPCIEIWFDAYFGAMHNYENSRACCQGFFKTWKKETGDKYAKSDPKIYEKLNRYGNEEKAIAIAEQIMQTYADSVVTKPSKMCPATTMQRLIGKIRQKAISAQNQMK